MGIIGLSINIGCLLKLDSINFVFFKIFRGYFYLIVWEECRKVDKGDKRNWKWMCWIELEVKRLRYYRMVKKVDWNGILVGS